MAKPKYAGAEWVERNGRALSPLGRDVANILGAAFRGIYHLEAAVLHKRVEWDNPRTIQVVMSGELATHDGSELAHLVIACAANGIRLAVHAASRGYLRLWFSRGEMMFCGTVRTPHELVRLYGEVEA